MSLVNGLSDIKLESCEVAISLEDVSFNNLNNTIDITVPVPNPDGTITNVVAKVNNNINAFYYDGYIKMNIPKLMPLYSVQRPYNAEYNVNKSIIANSSNCYPSVANKVTVCNYINVKAPSSFMNKSGISFNEKAYCTFSNGNITKPVMLQVD